MEPRHWLAKCEVEASSLALKSYLLNVLFQLSVFCGSEHMQHAFY